MFENGVIDRNSTGSPSENAHSQAHFDLAQEMAEKGTVLLKNGAQLLPLSAIKCSNIAVFGTDATKLNQIDEFGEISPDPTILVQAPYDSISSRAALDNISVTYAEAYPGTSHFPQAPSYMFGSSGLSVTYWTNLDYFGTPNQTLTALNISSVAYRANLWVSWPQVFSARYEGTVYPNTTGLYHYFLYESGDALFWLDEKLVANMSGANFSKGCSRHCQPHR
jgi:beta-glucosidase